VKRGDFKLDTWLIIKQACLALLFFSMAIFFVSLSVTAFRLSKQAEELMKKSNDTLDDVNKKLESLNFIFELIDGFRHGLEGLVAGTVYNGVKSRMKKRKGE
jgi:predicted PurR-regulated permease PerM